MRKSYLYGSEPIESYFSTVRPSRESIIADCGMATWMWLEAEKEGKFYLINDLRNITGNSRLSDPTSEEFAGIGSVVVEEFDNEEERAQEIARRLDRANRSVKQQTARFEQRRKDKKRKKQKPEDEGGEAARPATIRPKPPSRSGSDAKPLPFSEE